MTSIKFDKTFISISALKKEEIRCLQSLTINFSGDLRPNGTKPDSVFFNRLQRVLDGQDYSANLFINRAYHNDKCIAWCMLYYNDFGVFVLPEYRRQKIGTQFFEKAKYFIKTKNYQTIKVNVWSDTSEAFYTKLKCKVEMPYIRHRPGFIGTSIFSL